MTTSRESKELSHGHRPTSDEDARATPPSSDTTSKPTSSSRRSRTARAKTWWDKLLKLLIITTVGSEALDVKSYPETELGRFPPRIDLIVIIHNRTAMKNYKGPLAFLMNEFEDVTFIEFKSLSDSVDAGIFKRICGHFGHYADQNQLSWSQWRNMLSGIAIVARGAQRILNDWNVSNVNVKKLRDGVYLTNDPWKFILVDLETIEPTDETAPLMLLAPKPRSLTAIHKLFEREELRKYLKVAYWLYPKEVQEMARSLDVMVEPDIKTAVELLGISRVIEEVGLTRVLAEVEPLLVLRELARSPELQDKLLNDPSIDEETKQHLRAIFQRLAK